MKQHVYIVWSHPRRNSLTAQMVHSLRQRAEARGAHVTELDLYRSDFDPVLRVEDEPEWDNPDKRYSPEVHRLFAELDNQDIIFFVFPVWWYSFPAMLKGYLERVWNYGLAYGEQNRLTAKRCAGWRWRAAPIGHLLNMAGRKTSPIIFWAFRLIWRSAMWTSISSTTR